MARWRECQRTDDYLVKPRNKDPEKDLKTTVTCRHLNSFGASHKDGWVTMLNQGRWVDDEQDKFASRWMCLNQPALARLALLQVLSYLRRAFNADDTSGGLFQMLPLCGYKSLLFWTQPADITICTFWVCKIQFTYLSRSPYSCQIVWAFCSEKSNVSINSKVGIWHSSWSWYQTKNILHAKRIVSWIWYFFNQLSYAWLTLGCTGL